MEIAVLVTLALFLACYPAHAANPAANVVERNGVNFNATTNQVVEPTTGAVATAERFPPTSLYRTYTILDGVSIALAAADSCLPLPTNGLRIKSITVKCVGGAGTGGINRLAFSFRKNIDGSADSTRTSNFYGFPSFDNSASAQLDTLNAGHLFSGSTSTPWSGEFTLTFNRARIGPDGTAALFFYPSAQTHMLTKFYGSDLISEYFSVRVRNTLGPTVRVWVWVEAAAL